MDILKKIEQVKAGELSALKILKEVKDLKDYIVQELKEIQSIAVEEAKDYEKNFKIHGFQFIKTNGKTVWDYKEIKEWVDAKKKLTEIELKYKGSFYQYQKGVANIDEETGEVLIIPKNKQSNDYLKVKKLK